MQFTAIGKLVARALELPEIPADFIAEYKDTANLFVDVYYGDHNMRVMGRSDEDHQHFMIQDIEPPDVRAVSLFVKDLLNDARQATRATFVSFVSKTDNKEIIVAVDVLSCTSWGRQIIMATSPPLRIEPTRHPSRTLFKPAHPIQSPSPRVTSDPDSQRWPATQQLWGST